MRGWPVVVTAVAALGVLPPSVAAAPARPATKAAVVSDLTPKVQRTLQALDRLHSFGYSVNTPARADRAIRHWQQANGLVVDGIVGPQTLASLGLTTAATASVPAVRTSPPAAAPSDTEAIIRDVWSVEPADVVDEAVRIAKRESGPKLKVDAANACCHGIFQIHFTAHRAWLGDYGVHQPSDLYDPRVNATVALALYQASGWGPWKL